MDHQHHYLPNFHCCHHHDFYNHHHRREEEAAAQECLTMDDAEVLVRLFLCVYVNTCGIAYACLRDLCACVCMFTVAFIKILDYTQDRPDLIFDGKQLGDDENPKKKHISKR